MQLKILPLFFLSACCAGAQTLPHGAAGLPEDSTRTTTKAPLRERRLGEATVMGMSEARRTKVAPLTVSVLGLLVNMVVAWYILRHSDTEGNLNMKSAYLHVLGDLLGSLGAIVAALLLMAFG